MPTVQIIIDLIMCLDISYLLGDVLDFRKACYND